MTQESVNEIINRLNEEGRQKGLSSRFLEFYERLLRIQLQVEPQITVPQSTLTKDAIRERREGGLPFLTFSELALDWPLLRNTLAEITTLFADFPDLFGEMPESLGELSKEAVRARFDGTGLPAISHNVSQELLEAIIDAALRPFLVSYGKALIKLVDQESWRRHYCPVCGGKPDFAFLDKERGSRWLVCSRCDSPWLFQRLQCPCCGTQNQNALSYFTDEKGHYRLYVCEQCHTYIKAIDLRGTESKFLPSLERVLTLEIDRQAQEKGYKPGCAKTILPQ